ncbi:hypothetical protein I4U23_030311 [Adineta vaga]|nr:hypothetical protein I4U23_030311 [Adineta vaga]
MGSKTGKYAFDKKISLHDSEEKKQSKNDELSLPKLIHQDSLSNASSSSNNGNLTLVWLDPELNNQPANIDVQIKLKNLIGYLRTFTDIPTCEQYIEQIGEMNDNELLNGEKLFLIIPPELSFAMIPNIHDFPQQLHIQK